MRSGSDRRCIQGPSNECRAVTAGSYVRIAVQRLSRNGATFGANIDNKMTTEVQDIATQLGGEKAIGRPIRTERDIDAAIREGFPQKVVTEVMHSADLTLKELALSLDLSPRSLQRRRREGKLAKYESDRIYRLARLIALAKRYIGDDDKARRWLKRPNRSLGGLAPFDLIDTEPGARAVENILGRIAYGGVS